MTERFLRVSFLGRNAADRGEKIASAWGKFCFDAALRRHHLPILGCLKIAVDRRNPGPVGPMNNGINHLPTGSGDYPSIAAPKRRVSCGLPCSTGAPVYMFRGVLGKHKCFTKANIQKTKIFNMPVLGGGSICCFGKHPCV